MLLDRQTLIKNDSEYTNDSGQRANDPPKIGIIQNSKSNGNINRNMMSW